MVALKEAEGRRGGMEEEGNNIIEVNEGWMEGKEGRGKIRRRRERRGEGGGAATGLSNYLRFSCKNSFGHRHTVNRFKCT